MCHRIDASKFWGHLEVKKIAWDDEGRLHEEGGGFLLHFDENGKGVPVM